MGKLEATIKSEIERLAKRELHTVSVPLKREVRLLKISVLQLRRAVLSLERFAALKQKELAKQGVRLVASPEITLFEFDCVGKLGFCPYQLFTFLRIKVF